MFKFLTELVRGIAKADAGSTNHAPAQREHPKQLSPGVGGARFRPTLETLEERVTPGGGMWAG